MRRRVLFLVLAVGMLAEITAAETYLFTPAVSKRRMKVVRKYDILVMPDQVNAAEIPAMFSFSGATNEQTIESSVFTFSVPPDETSVVCHELGMPRKMYRMTWKNPTAIGVTVTQEMVVTLTARNRLFTTAKLPYSEAAQERYSYYLKKSKDGDINPDNPALKPICDMIMTRSGKNAEATASGVCDWIADNIEWVKGKGDGSDTVIESKRGNSYGLSNLACAMLRKMGVPCDVVESKYVNGDNGYGFIELYYPDTGWVFYDLACPTRGFMTLDCLAGIGWAYEYKNSPDKPFEWVEGYFCNEWDIGKYVEPEPVMKKALRSTPGKKNALSVMVMANPVPAGLPVRQAPLRDLMLDPNTLPPPVVEKKARDDAFESDKPKDAGGRRKE